MAGTNASRGATGRLRAVARAAWLGAITLTVAGLALATPVFAEDRGPTRAQVTERNEDLLNLWETLRARAAGMRIRLRQELVSTGEFEGSRLAWTRSEVGFEAGVPLLEGRLKLGVSPTFAWERLSIAGSDEFVVSQTGRDRGFTDFYDTSLRLGASLDLDRGFGVEAISGWSAQHERAADVRESSQVGGSLALTYRRGSWLRLRLGLGAGADLDDRRLRFSPVYRIVLRPHPRLAFESSGLGATVEWDATTTTSLSLGAQADGTQYRLAHRGAPPSGTGDGTLKRRQTRIDLGLLHRFHEHLRFRAGVGVVVDEEIEIADEDGVTTERRQNRDPSARLMVGLDLRL